MIRILSLNDVAHFREGGENAQGWAFQRKPASGMAACRCCGHAIAKGENALVGHVNWADTNNAWQATKIWLHIECQEKQSSDAVVTKILW